MPGETLSHTLDAAVQSLPEFLLVGRQCRGGVDHQAALDDLIGKGGGFGIHGQDKPGVFLHGRGKFVLDNVAAVV